MNPLAQCCEGCGTLFFAPTLQCSRCGDSFDGPRWLRWVGIGVAAAVVIEGLAWGLDWRPPSFSDGAQNQALFAVAGFTIEKLAHAASRGPGRALDEWLSVFAEPLLRICTLLLVALLAWVMAGGAMPAVAPSQSPEWWRQIRFGVLLPWAPTVLVFSLVRFGPRWLDPRVRAPARRPPGPGTP